MNEAREWLQALIAPVIAIAGIFIAWRQHKLDRNKARSELFDRRFVVYESLIEVFKSAGIDNGLTNEVIVKFYAVTAKAPFLFGTDVDRYLVEVKERLLEASMVAEEQKDGANPSKEALARKREHRQWFRDQILAARRVFAPYLNLHY